MFEKTPTIPLLRYRFLIKTAVVLIKQKCVHSRIRPWDSALWVIIEFRAPLMVLFKQ
jgi:hypothetical protein